MNSQGRLTPALSLCALIGLVQHIYGVSMSIPFKLRLGTRVATADPRMHIRQLGIVMPRPNDARGDSVNVLCAGGRLDALTEFLDERTDRQDQLDRAAINAEVAEAQVVNDVPVTEPVIPAPAAA